MSIWRKGQRERDRERGTERERERTKHTDGLGGNAGDALEDDGVLNGVTGREGGTNTGPLTSLSSSSITMYNKIHARRWSGKRHRETESETKLEFEAIQEQLRRVVNRADETHSIYLYKLQTRDLFVAISHDNQKPKH
jgi:hypothetical protein